MRTWPAMLRLGAALWAASLLCGAQAQQPSVDPQTATIVDSRLASGVPLGGLGAGKVELLTDGTFGSLTLNNNWSRPIPDLPASFFAVKARTADGAAREGTARVLALRSPHGFPTVGGVRYHGAFPRADLQFTDSELPVEVSLQATSSLVPHNAKDSSLPVAFFTVTLRNPSKSRVEATVAFSWENVLGRGGDARVEYSDRTGNQQQTRTADGRTGLVFSTSQQQQGRRLNPLGQYTVLAETEGGRVSTIPYWNAAGDGKEFWDAFTSGGSGPAPRVGSEGSVHPAGAVLATAAVPGEGTAQVHFILAWHTPHLVTAGGADLGHAYANDFPDAWSVASYAAQYRDTLLSGTAEWQDLVHKSSLPSWLRHKLLNDAFPLVSNTLYTKDGRFATLESPAETDAGLGALDHWLLSRTLLGSLYPKLDRQELELFAQSQPQTGEPRRLLGTLADGFSPQDANGSRPDVACSYVLAHYRHYRWGGDVEAMKASFPSIMRALGWLERQDTDGDGIPEGGSTWTYQQVPGTFSYTASLYLAALRAGEVMAKGAGDRRAEDHYRDRYRVARDNAMAQLWNGRFFTKSLSPESGDRSGNAFVGALAGEWAGEMLGLPEQYDAPVVNAGLRGLQDMLLAPSGYLPPNEVSGTGALVSALSEISWAPHLETYLGALSIARGRADAGLNVASRVNDIQFSVSRSPWDAALGYSPRTAQQIGPRSHVATMASWNVYTAVTGVVLDDPASRLTVAPSLPTAANGLHAPLFSPRYWAWIDYARHPNNAATNLRLKLLKKFDDRTVALSALTTNAPAGAQVETLTLLVSGPAGPILGRAEIADGKLTYVFKQPYEWRLGETLEFTVVPPDANNIVLQFKPDKVFSYGALVSAKDVRRDQDVRFTLVNPSPERQVVKVRFRNLPDLNFEVYQNGQAVQRFTPQNQADRLTLTIPASPISYERVQRLQEAEARLRGAREEAAGQSAASAVDSYTAPILEKLRAALSADETARSSQVLMHPYGNKLFRSKLKDAPPAVPAVDPEPPVVAAEEALDAAPKQAMELEPAARNVVLRALFPAAVTVTSAGKDEPGEMVRFQVALVNRSARPVRADLEAAFPAGWSGPRSLPRAVLEPGEARSFEVPVRLSPTLDEKRYTVPGKVVMSAEGAAWEVPFALRAGHAYLRDWSVIGPWKAALSDPLPPDTELDPAKSYDGRAWRVAKSDTARFDLTRVVGPFADGVAYAVTQVFSPMEVAAVLEVGADGGVQAKVNGEVVLNRPERPGDVKGVPGEEKTGIRLRQGWNLIVLKLSRPAAAAAPGWGFYAEVTDRDGSTPAGIRVNPNLAL